MTLATQAYNQSIPSSIKRPKTSRHQDAETSHLFLGTLSAPHSSMWRKFFLSALKSLKAAALDEQYLAKDDHHGGRSAEIQFP